MTSPAPVESKHAPQRPRGLARALLLLASVLVAGLLGFAAYAKWATKPPAAGDVMGWVTIGGEILASVLILLLHRRWWAWTVIAIVFGAFTGYTMHRLFGGARSCGCFGKFTVAPEITISIDAAMAAMALGCVCLAGARRGWLWLTGALLLPAAIGGGLYGMSQPTPDDFKPGSAFERAAQARQAAKAAAGTETAPAVGDAPAPAAAEQAVAFDPMSSRPMDVLLLVPLVQEEFLQGQPEPAWLTRLGEAAAETDGPAWLLFVYDPNCDVCQRFLPYYDGYERSSADDALLRVVTIQKGHLVQFGIEDWAWAHSPTTMLVRRGEILHEWGGEDTPIPGAIRSRIESEGEAFFESMQATYTPLE